MTHNPLPKPWRWNQYDGKYLPIITAINTSERTSNLSQEMKLHEKKFRDERNIFPTYTDKQPDVGIIPELQWVRHGNAGLARLFLTVNS